MHETISFRLAAVSEIEKRFPQGQDFSSSPTLANAKRSLIGSQVIDAETKKAATRQVAYEKGLDNELNALANRQIAQSTLETKEKDDLAAFNRKLFSAEYEVRRAMIQSEIDLIEQEKQENQAIVAQKKLVKYLTSPRVKGLLAPFTTPDSIKFGAHHETYIIESQSPQPASLSRIASLGNPRTLDPSRKGLTNLLFYVNGNATSRPVWTSHHQKWSEAGETFKNQDGDMVNPYIEAQRILREHGQTLVDLGMLVK